MKPICVPCQRFYRPKKNGQHFIEAMPRPGHERAEPGNSQPDSWEPYKLWVGDLWECAGCNHQIISGVGRGPVAEHYQPEFMKLALNAGFQVNDC